MDQSEQQFVILPSYKSCIVTIILHPRLYADLVHFLVDMVEEHIKGTALLR